MELKTLTVSALLAYVKGLLTQDYLLQNAAVTGEISSYRPHQSGHMYFVLKDEIAQVKCVMFRTKNSRLNFTPENGLRVVIRGYFSLYEKDGQVQFYVEEMQEEGIGSLHAAFEKLKEKLKQEGLFAEIYKKQLPLIPKKIGVVTSSSGAVINDIRIVLSRRFPTEIVLVPCQVQGNDAAKTIVQAIKTLQNTPDIEVIIVARGGGSIEDLWPFNTEEVARAVFASNIPIISAVGHETDFTICDFVADVRAATPSQAAEIVMPVKAELIKNHAHLNLRLGSAFAKITAERRQYLDILLDKIGSNLTLTYERKHAILKAKVGQLDSMSPLKVLARGYSLCFDSKMNLIKSISQTNKNDVLTIKTTDGRIDCEVLKIQGESHDKR